MLTNERPSCRSLVLSQRAHWAADQAIGFLMQQGLENRDCLSLAAGFVDESRLPVGECRVAADALLGDLASGRQALQYGTTQGSETLRTAILHHLSHLEQVPVDQLGITREQIVLTTGSQQLLALLADALFNPGDLCLVAAPTYFVFLGVLDGVGAKTLAVGTDEHGMQPEALEQVLGELEAAGELSRVKMIYLVSDFENPSGVTLAAERRTAIVQIAKRWSKEQRILVLEDAAYRELRYDGKPLPSVWSQDPEHEHVILAMTFSKSFAPGLRTGFGVLPTDLLAAVSNLKGNQDFGSAHWNQQLLAEVMVSGQYQKHVQSVREAYRLKRDAMLAAAEEYFGPLEGVTWVRPEGGLYVWMSLPKPVETGFQSQLFQRATKHHQVMYVPGELCYPQKTGTPARHQMRLSFGVLSPELIREGMRRLAGAVQECL